MKVLQAVCASLILTGCAALPQQPPAGYDCDPSGSCWPQEFEVTKPYRVSTVTPEEVTYICGQNKENAEILFEGGYILACVLLFPNPIIIFPAYLEPERILKGWNLEDVMQHEKGHIMDLTVHHMIRKRAPHEIAHHH